MVLWCGEVWAAVVKSRSGGLLERKELRHWGRHWGKPGKSVGLEPPPAEPTGGIPAAVTALDSTDSAGINHLAAPGLSAGGWN